MNKLADEQLNIYAYKSPSAGFSGPHQLVTPSLLLVVAGGQDTLFQMPNRLQKHPKTDKGTCKRLKGLKSVHLPMRGIG